MCLTETMAERHIRRCEWKWHKRNFKEPEMSLTTIIIKIGQAFALTEIRFCLKDLKTNQKVEKSGPLFKQWDL